MLYARVQAAAPGVSAWLRPKGTPAGFAWAIPSRWRSAR